MDPVQFKAFLDQQAEIVKSFGNQQQQFHDTEVKLSADQHAALLAQQKGAVEQKNNYEKRQELVAQTVRCDGSSQRLVRQWMKDIDLIVDGNATQILVALRTAEHSFRTEAERFVHDHAKERLEVPWPELRTYLEESFLTSDEKANARVELKKTKQTQHETIPHFNRRFRDVAERAFPTGIDQEGRPLRNADQHQIMIDLYGTSLYSNKMAREMVRGQYVDIEVAMKGVAGARTQQEAYDRLGRQEEPHR